MCTDQMRSRFARVLFDSNRTALRVAALGTVLFGGGALVGGTVISQFHQPARLDTANPPTKPVPPPTTTVASSATEKLKHKERLSQTSKNDANARADQYLAQRKESVGSPGVVAAAWCADCGSNGSGRLLWQRAIGLADVENGVPLTTEYHLRIASVSKPLTTLALATLIDSGRIDIDSDIRRYLPDWKPTFTAAALKPPPPAATTAATADATPPAPTPTNTKPAWTERELKITPRMLASHLSGIRHYSGTEFFSNSPYTTVSDSMRCFRDDALSVEPGTKFLYSTHGYTVLSAVMEAAVGGGATFNQIVRDSTLAPLGLTELFPESASELQPFRARYYYRTGSNANLQNAPYVDVSSKWAGGGYVSTARDLARFGGALVSPTQSLIRPDTLKLLWTPATLTDGSATKYGLGWSVKTDPRIASANGGDGGDGGGGGRYIGHSGGACGGTSYLLLLPEDRISVSVLANIGSGDWESLALQLGLLFAEERKRDRERHQPQTQQQTQSTAAAAPAPPAAKKPESPPSQ